MVEYIMLIL